jgi:hypothetical protein
MQDEEDDDEEDEDGDEEWGTAPAKSLMTTKARAPASAKPAKETIEHLRTLGWECPGPIEGNTYAPDRIIKQEYEVPSALRAPPARDPLNAEGAGGGALRGDAVEWVAPLEALHDPRELGRREMRGLRQGVHAGWPPKGRRAGQHAADPLHEHPPAGGRTATRSERPAEGSA